MGASYRSTTPGSYHCPLAKGIEVAQSHGWEEASPSGQNLDFGKRRKQQRHSLKQRGSRIYSKTTSSWASHFPFFLLLLNPTTSQLTVVFCTILSTSVGVFHSKLGKTD